MSGHIEGDEHCPHCGDNCSCDSCDCECPPSLPHCPVHVVITLNEFVKLAGQVHDARGLLGEVNFLASAATEYDYRDFMRRKDAFLARTDPKRSA